MSMVSKLKLPEGQEGHYFIEPLAYQAWKRSKPPLSLPPKFCEGRRIGIISPSPSLGLGSATN